MLSRQPDGKQFFFTLFAMIIQKLRCLFFVALDRRPGRARRGLPARILLRSVGRREVLGTLISFSSLSAQEVYSTTYNCHRSRLLV